MLELLKILVQPILLERSEDGEIIGERVGETTPLYTPDDLALYVEKLRASVEQLAKEEAAAGAETNGLVVVEKELLKPSGKRR